MKPKVFSIASLLGSSLLLSLWACASLPSTAQQASAFVPMSRIDAAALLPPPRTEGSQVTSYVADGRFTHFAAGRRTRAQLRLLVQRPDRWRTTVLGPQGSALWVLACDGRRLTSYDLINNQFREVPASQGGLSDLLPGLDLALSPRAFVMLLFGEVELPQDAAACASSTAVRYAWSDGDGRFQADLDRSTGSLLRLSYAGEGGGPEAIVADVLHTNANGLAERLRVSATTQKEGHLEVQALDVEVDHLRLSPPISEQVFSVRP